MPPTDARARGVPAEKVWRLERERSLLLIVDIQARLAPTVEGHDALVARTGALLAAARLFRVPVVATEHCPERIGPLVDPLRAKLDAGELFVKRRFSAADHSEFMARLGRSARSQIVVAGMEAHVCVMQTSLGLAMAGYDVYVAVDAAGSRGTRQADRALALERMRAAGCQLAGTETVLFEWTGGGDDDAFKDVLGLVKALP